MTLHKNGAYNLPENWHKCPDIPSLRSSAVLPESFRRFPRSTAVSHAEITNAIPPCLQFNVVRVISCIRFKHCWTHISSDKHCVGITNYGYSGVQAIFPRGGGLIQGEEISKIIAEVALAQVLGDGLTLRIVA